MAVEPSPGDSSPPAVRSTPTEAWNRSGPAPVLLDGSAEGRLLPHLIGRLRDPGLDRIDMAVPFHPKAYIFWSSAGEAAAGYVGSSNLSASGIDGGVEWNLGVDRVEQLVAGFDSLWTDERSKPLDATSPSACAGGRTARGGVP